MERATGDPQASISINSNIIAGKTINLVNNVENVKVKNVTINNKPELSHVTRLKTALNPVTSASYDSYEAKQRSECFPNTRVQVLDDIEAWIRGESNQAPIYILDGVAGIGKSAIAQTIAVKAAAIGLLGASFFFSRDEDLRKIARHFFPTIAYQLGRYNDQFAAKIIRSLEQDPDAPAKRLYQQLLLLFLQPLEDVLPQRATPTIVVIDALDECEEESAEELLSLLGQHVHRVKGLKVLITMRPEAHLRDVLDQDKHHERFRLHEIEDFIVLADIRLYLQSRLSVEEVRKVSRNKRTPWQPTAKDIEMLCGICGTLFIIATTATKFILDRKRLNPESQLARLLDGVSTPCFSGSKHTHILDETYVRIILAAQYDSSEIDSDWFRDLNRVLGALIALSKPLPCNAFASLLKMEVDDVEATLSQLHSLVAPSGSGENIIFRIHHKSFPDFITDRARIQQVLSRWKSNLHPHLDSLLWVDAGLQHLQLAKACLQIMNCDLKWNIADIKDTDWSKDKDDGPYVIPPLSQDLAYAALHWASHLLSAHGFDADSELQNDLHVWASKSILTWMEVMVILNRVNGIYDILQGAIESVKHITNSAWKQRAQVLELLSDASRFVQQGSEIMRLSPIHIYRSCLPFIPEETSLAKAYQSNATLKIAFGRSPHWSPTIAILIGHSNAVTSVAFTSDGSQLASGGSWDKTIRLWDAKTGAHLSTLISGTCVNSVAFSNDGSRLASGGYDETIQLWDTKTGSLISTFAGHSKSVMSVVFLLGDSQLASGSEDKTIRLWGAKTGEHISTLIGHSDFVLCVTFSSAGSRLASGSADNTIRLWDAKTGAHIFTLVGHSNEVWSVAFSNDGSRLASGSDDRTIRFWDANTGAHVSTLTGFPEFVRCVAFSSDDSQLASNGSSDKSIQFWDIKTGTHVSTLAGYSDAINSIAFSIDGARMASASNDNTLRLWDLKAGINNSVWMGHLVSVLFVAFSGDGSLLASASCDNTIRLWDTSAGVHLSTFTGHSDFVRSVAFSSNGSQLASGSDDKTVRLWDVKTGTLISTLIGHLDRVYPVAFSSDGSRLASGSSDKTVRLWDAKKGTLISSLAGHSKRACSVAFSSDDSRLASGSFDQTIRLWDVNTGTLISTLAGHSHWVMSVAFWRDNSLLASGSHDGTIRIWNVKAAMHVSTLTIPWTSTITSLVFLRDDSQIVNQLAPRSYQTLRSRNQNHATHMLALVGRHDPPITGLVMVSSLLGVEDSLKWQVALVCWFPPNMKPKSLAVNHLNTQVSVGCHSGRVMIFDFQSDSPQSEI